MFSEVEQLIKIGMILKPHGVHGEFKVSPLTDDPNRFEKLSKAFIGTEQKPIEYEIESVKHMNAAVVLKLKGVDSIESAGLLRGKYILINRSDLMKLPEGAFYIFEMIGCEVYDESGKSLGELTDVISTGSNDVYVVKVKDGGEILIPALKEVVKSVSIADKRISVKLPEGLVDDV